MKKNNKYRTFIFITCLFTTTCLWADNTQQLEPSKVLTFDSYLNQVYKQNLAFLANKLNVNIAEAEILVAKVLPDPSIDFEASKETFSLGLSYPLELGKRRARINLAKSQKEMESLAVEQSLHDLRAQAAELFLDAILQKELLNVKERSYSYMIQLCQSDSLRFVSGEITAIDARQSKIEAIGLLNEVYDQEAMYHSALVELNKFMGQSVDTLHLPQGDWNHLSYDFTLQELLQTGLQHRIDLLAANKDIDVYKKAYKLVCKERRPDIDLSLSYKRDWHGFLPKAEFATIGVSVPLSFSAINKGTRRIIRYQTEQATLQAKDMQLLVEAEICQFWYNFEAEKKKVNQYQGGVLNDALKVMNGMVYKYKRGEASIQDVLIAQRTFNDVQQDYLETMKGFVSALVTLEKACGIWNIHF